jgi:hypothetical protein
MEEEKRGNVMQSKLNNHIVRHKVGLNFEAGSHERQRTNLVEEMMIFHVASPTVKSLPWNYYLAVKDKAIITFKKKKR